jgi:hypothetical protein
MSKHITIEQNISVLSHSASHQDFTKTKTISDSFNPKNKNPLASENFHLSLSKKTAQPGTVHVGPKHSHRGEKRLPTLKSLLQLTRPICEMQKRNDTQPASFVRQNGEFDPNHFNIEENQQDYSGDKIPVAHSQRPSISDQRLMGKNSFGPTSRLVQKITDQLVSPRSNRQFRSTGNFQNIYNRKNSNFRDSRVSVRDRYIYGVDQGPEQLINMNCTVVKNLMDP